MAIELITGQSGGVAHVGSADFGKLNAAIIGSGNYLMVGLGDNELNAYMATSNTLRAESGNIVAQGRHIIVDSDTIEWMVQNGTQGQKRIDIAALKYTKDTASGIEDIKPVVIKGTPVVDNPKDPVYVAGDILNGEAVEALIPVFRVTLTGTVPGTPQLLLTRMDTAAIARAKLLPKTGGTVDGTVVFAKQNNVMAGSYNAPAMVAGGEPNEPHIEVGANKIMAKSDAETPTDLAINGEGGNVIFGGSIKPKIPLAVECGGTGVQGRREVADNLLLPSLARGTRIPLHANLDNYNKPGNFVCDDFVISKSVVNNPTLGVAFRLTVYAILGSVSDGGHIAQEVIVYDTGQRYYRCRDRDTWYPWFSVPYFANGLLAVGYYSSSDVVYLGLSSNATIGAKGKNTILRGKLSGLVDIDSSGTIFKRLWSGTLAPGGTVTVRGLSDYNVIIAMPINEGMAMIGARSTIGGTGIRCSGAFDAGDGGTHGSVQAYQASFVTDGGDKITCVGASSYYLLDGTNMRKSIGQIWGLL